MRKSRKVKGGNLVNTVENQGQKLKNQASVQANQLKNTTEEGVEKTKGFFSNLFNSAKQTITNIGGRRHTHKKRSRRAKRRSNRVLLRKRVSRRKKCH